MNDLTQLPNFRIIDRKKSIQPTDVDHDCTYEELAQRFGVSRQRIRQIECRALYKIAEALLDDSEGRQMIEDFKNGSSENAEDHIVNFRRLA